MKKYICLLISLILILLCGCSKDYTKDDALSIIDKYKIDAEFISEEPNEKDTIWTFKDNKTDLTFRIIENWNIISIDATQFETSDLINEYPYKITDYYLSNLNYTAKIEKTYYYEYPDFIKTYYLVYDIYNKDELKDKIKECNKISKSLLRKNKNCKFTVQFNLNFDSYYEYTGFINKRHSKIKYKKVLEKYNNSITNK